VSGGAASESSTPDKRSTSSRAGQLVGGQHSSYGSGLTGDARSTALQARLLADPLPLPSVDTWEPETEPDFGPDYEAVPASMRDKVGVAIRGLRKEFKRDGNHLVAVEGLDLNLYTGQIFVLLGHNGAGSATN